MRPGDEKVLIDLGDGVVVPGVARVDLALPGSDRTIVAWIDGKGRYYQYWTDAYGISAHDVTDEVLKRHSHVIAKRVGAMLARSAAEDAARRARSAAGRPKTDRDAPTQERETRLRRDPVLALFRSGRIGEREVRAALEIRDVAAYLAAGQFCRPVSIETRGQNAGFGGGDPTAAGLHAMARPDWFLAAEPRYRAWLDDLRAMTNEPVADVALSAIVDGHATRWLDRRYSQRNGWSAELTVRALESYTKQAKWET